MPKHRIWTIRSGIARPPKFTGIVYNNGGDFICWLNNGELHREDGPAVRRKCGYGSAVAKYWYIKGRQHRTDGPAVEYPDGDKHWFIMGKGYDVFQLDHIVKAGLYIGKEKGKYGLEWLKFMTERGMEEFPIIPGMKGNDNILRSIKELNSLTREEVF